MKTVIQRLAVLLIIYVFTTFASQAQNAKLTIKICGIEEIKGKIQIGIYNDASKFPNVGEQYKVGYLAVNANNMSYTINLPFGYYAIAIMHDEDEDGDCDKNFIGIPTEGYGFSNNVKPKLRAPSFDEAKIELKKDMTIQINMIY